MSDNRYSVIFTGQLKPDATAQMVIGNLVLDIGLPQEKVVQLLRKGRVVLKRCGTMVEAQRLAEKFDRAGAVCVIEDRLAREHAMANSVSGESSLVRFISKFIPSSYRQGTGSSASRRG